MGNTNHTGVLDTIFKYIWAIPDAGVLHAVFKYVREILVVRVCYILYSSIYGQYQYCRYSIIYSSVLKGDNSATGRAVIYSSIPLGAGSDYHRVR